MLRRIDGRKLDTLHTPAGHLLPGEYIVYAFLNIPSVKRYQVVQRELEMLDITLVPGEGFGEPVLEQIRREIAKVVGASVASVSTSPTTSHRVRAASSASRSASSTSSRGIDMTARARKRDSESTPPTAVQGGPMSGRLRAVVASRAFSVLRKHAAPAQDLRYLDEYERNQWFRRRMAALQWDKLKQLVDHCWREVPYYRRRWQEIGATPDDIRSLADYARLPTLTKADIRANFQDLHAVERGPDRVQGDGRLNRRATAFRLHARKLRAAHGRDVARLSLGRRAHGSADTLFVGRPAREPGLASAREGPHVSRGIRATHARFVRDERIEHRILCGRNQPESTGNRGGLTSVPRSGWPNGFWPRRAKVHAPRAIVTGAEALLEQQRDVIQRAFHAPVFNTYGCREFMLIASECEHRQGLHINADQLVLETVGGDHSGYADVVITDLHNYGMPFVRYVNGDLADSRWHGCSCGRGLPR